jgi:hypothetical protein
MPKRATNVKHQRSGNVPIAPRRAARATCGNSTIRLARPGSCCDVRRVLIQCEGTSLSLRQKVTLQDATAGALYEGAR